MGTSAGGPSGPSFDPTSWPKQARELWEKLEKAPPPPSRNGSSADEYRLAIDIWKVQVEAWKVAMQARLEAPKLTIEFSKLAITQILTINAGAIVAILALVGSLSARSPELVLGAMPKLAAGLTSFAAGATFAVVVAALSYLSQQTAGLLDVPKATGYQKWATRAFGGSLVAFLVGTAFVAFAFFQMPRS